jgi:hypothetical protein
MTGHKIINYKVELTQAEMELILAALNSAISSATDSAKADTLVDLGESFLTLLTSP